MTSSAVRRVLLLAYEGVQPLDLVGPHEVFVGATRVLDARGAGSAYEVEIVGPTAGPIVGESGLVFHVGRRLADLDPAEPMDTLLVAGGNGVDAAATDDDLVAWLRAAAATARRFGSVCSGTILLGRAGLIDGRRVTTHWRRGPQVAREFPAAIVDIDPIHIVDGPVWTSAGVTAGIDLALAMVEADHGAEIAQLVARHLVMFLRRPGGQSQFATAVWSDPPAHPPVRAAVEQIHADPGTDRSVPALAREVGMSERNFARVFTREVGTSPGRYLEQVRVEAARRRLEQDDAGVAAVARASGFGSAETMRKAFLRQIGVAPSDYRDRFRRTRTAPIDQPIRPAHRETAS